MMDDTEVRGDKRQFMLVVIAPRIGYLESLRIKEILEEIGNLIKQGSHLDLAKYRENVLEILENPSTNVHSQE